MEWSEIERQPYWSPRRPSVGIKRPKVLNQSKPAHNVESMRPSKIVRGESDSVTSESESR